MKKIGIWLDKKTAFLVTLRDTETSIEDKAASFEKVDSNLEFYNPKGGSRSKTRWGPQQVVHDSKYLEREKHQLRSFFKSVIEKLRDAEHIVIFGPGQTGLKMKKEIDAHYPELADRIIEVEKANSMSDNQIIAWVRSYFD